MNVKQIIFDADVIGLLLIPIFDLPPTRHPLRNGEALILPRFVAVYQPGQLRARPNQAHLSFEDVEQLGQLIQAEAA